MVAVSCIRTSGSCGFTTHATSGAKPGDAVRVVVTYPYRPFFPLLHGQTINMSSTVQMTLE
jgi:hypothetical protein